LSSSGQTFGKNGLHLYYRVILQEITWCYCKQWFSTFFGPYTIFWKS